MPTPTYVAISKNVLTSNQTSITLSSIPSTYTDLILKITARSTDAVNKYDAMLVQINSLTTGNTNTILYGYVTGNLSTRNTYGSTKNLIGQFSTAVSTSNTFGVSETYFPNYAGSTNKVMSTTAFSESAGNTAEVAYVSLVAGLLSNTAAISSLTFNFNVGNIASGSRFDLYGIKNS